MIFTGLFAWIIFTGLLVDRSFTGSFRLIIFTGAPGLYLWIIFTGLPGVLGASLLLCAASNTSEITASAQAGTVTMDNSIISISLKRLPPPFNGSIAPFNARKPMLTFLTS